MLNCVLVRMAIESAAVETERELMQGSEGNYIGCVALWAGAQDCRKGKGNMEDAS